MKKAIVSVLVAVIMIGCSTGPMGAIGPCSYYYGKHAETAAFERAMAKSQMPAADKAKVFKARAITTQPGELAAVVGVDVFAAVEAAQDNSYTWYEYAGQFLSALGDAAIYTGVGVAGSKALKNSSNSSAPTGGSVQNNGTMNNVSINIQQSNSGSTSQTPVHNQDSQNNTGAEL